MENSQNISFMDQYETLVTLGIKPNQYMVVDLDALMYNPTVRPLIEFLIHSQLKRVLLMFENVTILALSLTY